MTPRSRRDVSNSHFHFHYLPSNSAIAIVLPSQSITAEKDDTEPITRRQLTFGNLLSHLKHHNPGQRKGSVSLNLLYIFSNLVSDALLGLRELFNSNWEIVNSSLTPLVNALVRLIGDEVRVPSLLLR